MSIHYLHFWRENRETEIQNLLIVGKMLKRYFPEKEDFHIHLLAENVDEIEVHSVEQELLSYLSHGSLTLTMLDRLKDCSYTTYNELKESLRIMLGEHGILAIYISNNAASEDHMLAHIAAEEFQSRTVYLYEKEKEGISYYNTFSTSHYFSTTQKYHHAHEFISSGNYKSALKFLKNDISYEMKEILELGHSLLSLNIQKHKSQKDRFDILLEALRQIPEISKDELQYVEKMKKLRQYEQVPFIQFLHNYAEFLYEDNNLIDFVVLMYRLAEEFLLFATGWDVISGRQDDRSQFVTRSGSKFLIPLPKNTTRRYYDYFSAVKKEKMSIQKKYHPKVKIERNKVVGIELLNNYEQFIAELYSFFYSKKVVEFLDLRHNGVSGHGFADFSKEMFEEICEGESPIDMFRPMLEKLNILPQYSIFKLVEKGALSLMAPELTQKG